MTDSRDRNTPDTTTGTNTTGKDDNTALVLGKLRALANAADDHQRKAQNTYDDEQAKSLWHAGQAFLLASEAQRLTDEHAAAGGERLGPHDAANADAARAAAQAAANTEGAW